MEYTIEIMTAAATPQLIPADKLIASLVRDIAHAEAHIWVLSMIVNEDDTTEPFFNALIQAADRGVDVRFAADTFTYTELGGRMAFSRKFWRRARNVAKLRRKLRNSRIDFWWLGGYTYTTITGRTHAKWLVIDNVVYSFGGINLYDLGLETADFFIRVEDAELADRLTAEHIRIINANFREYAYHSHSFGSAFGTVLMDGGFVGDSVIYQRVCELAEGAERIVCVSQYCPTGKFAKLLKQHPNLELYYSSMKNSSFMNRLVIWFGRASTGLRSRYTRDRYIHAKYTIFYYPDGKRVAVTGSHNFVKAGVLLGTKEIALETTNAAIIDLLEAYTAEEIV